jgi:putative ABC transport system ATP-binding protein
MIQLINVGKIYNTSYLTRALDNISVEILSGKFTAVIGPSGSGKSTLLNIIGTLDRPTTGCIKIDHIDLAQLSGDKLADFRRNNIGFVFQLFNLIPALTALQNIMLPLLPYQKDLPFSLPDRAKQLMEDVGLEKKHNNLPGQLSGGEQQRVSIARALVNRPKILLADEPTGNLDSKSALDIFQLLLDLNREEGLTIVVVTHNENITEIADDILLLKDGRLIPSSRSS